MLVAVMPIVIFFLGFLAYKKFSLKETDSATEHKILNEQQNQNDWMLSQATGSYPAANPIPSTFNNQQGTKVVPTFSVEKTPNELDILIRDGYQSIAEMRRVESLSQSKAVKAKLRRMEEVSDLIYKQLKKTPEKLNDARKFLTDFVPTTMRVLSIYAELSKNNVQGANIGKTRKQVENMIGDIASAFERQLDAMYHSEAVTVSADISMLDTFMRREGLMGDEIHDLIMGYTPKTEDEKDEVFVDGYTDDISERSCARLLNGKFVRNG